MQVTPTEALAIARRSAADGDVAGAATVCRQLLARDPDDEVVLDLLADSLVRAGRPAEALDVVRQALRRSRTRELANTTAHGLHLLHSLGFRPRGILDLGAYDGEFTLLARQFWPSATALMVEPQAHKLAQLQRVARELGGEIAIEQALLGSAERDAVPFHLLATPFGSTGSSIYAERSGHPRTTVMLPMRTLDNLLAAVPDRTFDLGKLDVQGAELDVLRGGSAALRHFEVLFVELSLHEVDAGAPDLAAVVRELDAHDFAMFDLQPQPRDGCGRMLQTDAVFVRRSSPLWQRD